MFRRWLLVLPLFILSLGLAGNPGQDSIEFGGIRLALGMPKDQVIALLQPRYKVAPAPSFPKQRAGLFWVSEEGKRNGSTFGTLYFPEGTLTEATLDWTPEEPAAKPAVNTVRALFDAINRAVPDVYERRCLVALDRPSSRPPEIAGMVITCGDKIVNIGVSTHQGEDDRVYVMEALQAPLSGVRKGQSGQ